MEAIQQGFAPQAAIDGVIAKQPSFDAGFAALNLNSVIGLGNMPSVLRRADQSAAISQCDELGASVATIHPHKTIAILANEVSLEHMRRLSGKVVLIAVASGVKLSFGEVREIHVDQNLETMRVVHPEAKSFDVETTFGMGDKVKVTPFGTHLGWLDHEPLMLVKNRTVVALDGKDKIELPVFLREFDTSIQ